MGKTRDPAWKHGTMVNGTASRVRCNYCGHLMAGITRLKQHLAKKGGDVSPCTKCPSELTTEMMKQMKRGKVVKEKEEEASQLERAIKESLETLEMEKRKAEMDNRAYEDACRESLKSYEKEKKKWRGEGCSSSGTKRKASSSLDDFLMDSELGSDYDSDLGI